MNSEWQSLQTQTQQELKNTMNAMQPPQSIEEIKARLETTEKGGVRQSIRNCLTVFQRDFMPEDTKARMIQAYLDMWDFSVIKDLLMNPVYTGAIASQKKDYR